MTGLLLIYPVHIIHVVEVRACLKFLEFKGDNVVFQIISLDKKLIH